MDDAARLASELRDKLAELDGKVSAYQRDMLAEFQRHMDDCLKQYPDHVSSEVSRVIAESMSQHRALSPPPPPPLDTSQPPPGLSPAERKAWYGRKSPPPILYHTSGPKGPRSPHQREQEFQGLFTPSYLPLLDSTYHNIQSPPTSPAPTTTPALVLSEDNVKKAEQELAKPVVVKLEARPGPVRRLTDRSSSSIDSSSSEATKVRRSALRRTSSSTKGSPRRVRFEFQGEEIYPSTSLESAVDLVLADPAVEAKLEAASASAITINDESPAVVYTGTSLLDVEGEEDSFPRPKKVSSTQALRALSRSPLDEGTVWTVVNPVSDETPKMNGNGKEKEPTALSNAEPSLTAARPGDDVTENNTLPDELLGSPIEELENHNEDDTSDDEFLSMRPKASPRIPSPSARSPLGRFPTRIPTLPVTRSRVNSKALLDDVEDPLFDFDQEGGGAPQKYLADEDIDDDEEEEELVVPEPPRQPAPIGTPSFHSMQATRLPTTSPSAALFGHSVGSYKGNIMRVGPMHNTALYDEIANMKDVHFFVGSVDGRSGVEAADLGSYRAASISKAFPGTPRSFSERLAFEEAMERRRGEAASPDSMDDVTDTNGD
ncbi:hypothetical protein B0H63DRAFT_403637 [Podospora didyma]|uniref:Uncharacterized protein n=1 Tax=Podospora didyma TaxID=330526 RepID=A0AAE0K114_9PEZI|nr:hypothetical protein B0H63DRAFT_403637 [Podospora didyma]